MKYYICLCLALLLASFANAQEQTTPSQESPQKPKEISAAEVNGQPIYLSDVTRELNMMTGGRINPQKDRANYLRIRDQILTSLINQELIYQEGKKEGFELKDEEVKVEIDKVKSNFQSPENFQQVLKSQGLTEEKFTLIVKRILTMRKFIEAKVQPLAKPVTNEDIEEYYEAHKSQYAEPEKVNARHILIKVAPDDNEQKKAEAKNKIEDILKKACNGEDFAELAKANSECPSASRGGDLDYFTRGQMVKPFEDAVFALQPGQISDVVETKFGYHIIKLEDKKPGKQPNLDEVKAKIEDTLVNIAIDKALGEWLKPVRDRASVKILIKGESSTQPDNAKQE